MNKTAAGAICSNILVSINMMSQFYCPFLHSTVTQDLYNLFHPKGIQNALQRVFG